VELDLAFEHLDVAAHALLQFGADLEVLDPPELRQRIADTVEAMSARYATA
jgi:predicted DNA-binding transcriptional regulator YafY